MQNQVLNFLLGWTDDNNMLFLHYFIKKIKTYSLGSYSEQLIAERHISTMKF